MNILSEDFFFTYSYDLITVRTRRMGERNSFSLLVCPRGEGVPILARSKVPTPQPGQDGEVPQSTYPPSQVSTGGGGTPRYLPPMSGQDGGGGIPRYLPTQPRYIYLPPPPARSGWGYPKVSTPQPRYLPPPPSQVRTGEGSTPRYLPPPKVPTPPSQPRSYYTADGGRYASCFHAGGLSCYKTFTANIVSAFLQQARYVMFQTKM